MAIKVSPNVWLRNLILDYRDKARARVARQVATGAVNRKTGLPVTPLTEPIAVNAMYAHVQDMYARAYAADLFVAGSPATSQEAIAQAVADGVLRTGRNGFFLFLASDPDTRSTASATPGRVPLYQRLATREEWPGKPTALGQGNAKPRNGPVKTVTPPKA